MFYSFYISELFSVYASYIFYMLHWKMSKNTTKIYTVKLLSKDQY